jgi:hypothetical protein
MNEKRLAEIEARRKAITPGQWWVEYQERTTADGMTYYAPVVTANDVDIASVSYDLDADEDISRDAEFIANAANDIDALLAEIKRLRGGDWIPDAPTKTVDISIDMGELKRFLDGETITVDPLDSF